MDHDPASPSEQLASAGPGDDANDDSTDGDDHSEGSEGSLGSAMEADLNWAIDEAALARAHSAVVRHNSRYKRWASRREQSIAAYGGGGGGGGGAGAISPWGQQQ